MTPKYPRINPDRDRLRRFFLCEDVTVVLTDGNEMIIPKGYRFDGHSIPFLVRNAFPVYDLDVYCAMVHDYLSDTEMMHRYKRKFTDKQYWYFMHQSEYFATTTRRYLFPRVVWFIGFIKRTAWGR